MHFVIRGITFHGPHFKIPIIYRSFQSSSLHTFDELIKTYTRDHALNQGKHLHARLIVSGLASSNNFASKLISFYTETRQLSIVRKLFDRIPKPNFYQRTVLIGAYSRHGFYQDVLDVFSEMQNERLRPNKFVIPSVLRACGHVFDLQTGKILHSVILRHLFESDVVVNTALIDMYSRCRHVEKARKVFDGMQEKDLVALNAMVLGYAQNGFAKEGFLLVEQMQMLDIKPNLVTWNTLISGFAQAGDKVMVQELFGLMSMHGFEPDVISWTSVISRFVQNSHNEAAFAAFKQMLQHGAYPNSATISSLLPACASLANVRHGRELHGYAFAIGVEEDIYVRSAIVDMYSKCGLISEARMLFSKMPERHTVTWNSMIFGYANHGYCDEAIELFNQMEKTEAKKIDHLSFTAVLTACSHGRLVELGQSLFLLMHEKYKIVPRLEHYACMIDLLGRAGKLSEAYDMIKTMPVEPDLFVWGALLGACRQHGEIDLAEIAARHLAELEPRNAGNNMLLSNLYADAGSWENVAKLKMGKRKRLRKFSAYSWIQLL
ncbi:pentatricopeptide repeat-containing protein, putative [Ricinus communis]|uniref:Pentatricopeptide repeat-containing protein, putative n=1 Tax=Ricinus communis TaxID=3988 RepID=B9S3G4_RICCO|nr:pentatricopeptide repeat-containing protein, putative [Ricinus communis]|eukprot:XP_002520533.1 pentatricopeptide repeat-containing protein At5g59600 [Ricinus communis]